MTYTTISGDSWDKIALNVYGSEKYIGYLMENNQSKLGTFIFSAGVILNTPKLDDKTENEANLPEWRK